MLMDQARKYIELSIKNNYEDPRSSESMGKAVSPVRHLSYNIFSVFNDSVNKMVFKEIMPVFTVLWKWRKLLSTREV